MQLSLTTLALAFISLVASHELLVIKKDSKRVVVESKGNGHTLWFSMAIIDGVPSFEIKGSKKDDEPNAKAKVQLLMSKVHEEGSKINYDLQGTQSYWGNIDVEHIDTKDPNQIILRNTMVHPDKDMAGNPFTVLIESIIGKDTNELSIRTMIQNFPYRKKLGKGTLELDQILASSIKIDPRQVSNEAIDLGSYGILAIPPDSTFEDGNQGDIGSLKLRDLSDSCPKAISGTKSEKYVELKLLTTRPKNATITEKLIFNPKALNLNKQGDDMEDEIQNNLEGLTNDGASVSQNLIKVGIIAITIATLLSHI